MKKTIYDSKEYLEKMNKYFRAANYLSVGQMYLRNNPLLKSELTSDDVKIYPIGHWGTIPGQNFIYAHLNRVIKKYDLNMFYIEGPGHGGQVMISNSYLDGSYSEIYPEISQDAKGMQKMFKRFSFPGGTASHAAPETPGSIHEGGELGYSLSHATGAILDSPDLIAATVVGDGEAETGPLCASWFSNVFINPVNDGVVLPIVHVNGGKISNPTILARKSNKDLIDYFSGMGWDAIIVEGDDVKKMHVLMAKAMDKTIEKILEIKAFFKGKKASEAIRPKWPMLVVKTPKGWTGPSEWNGQRLVGSFRAHQVPVPVSAKNMEAVDALTYWLKSYKPEELFLDDGSVVQDIKDTVPSGLKRMAMNPATNGGINPKVLNLPDWKKYSLDVKKGETKSQDMVELGKYLSEVITNNPDNFRIFGPDETKSNRLYDIFKVTKRQWLEEVNPLLDEWIGPEGRVIDSQLSEHQAEGFLEGYVLTGRHGFFASYESFLRVVDTMLTQHMKWMKKSLELPWRKDFPSLNVIATSTAFQQDHNGYTHQDPGLLGHLADKRPELIREYLPADTNTLLATMDKSLTERNVINLIVASKQPRDQFYTKDEAEYLVEKGLKVIDWASTCKDDEEPDLVIAASGVEPNIEALSAITYLNNHFKNLKIRYVYVLDLLKLRHPSIDPRGISDKEFDKIFTTNKPVVFAFHGFEAQLRDIFYPRKNRKLIPHGYRENGDITTSFDIRQLSEMDRFHIAKDAALATLGKDGDKFAKLMDEKVAEHNAYIKEYGYDMPEVLNWKWENVSKVKSKK
ncbi:phosphoketolase family protein [Metamycoplasma subdolum]|uniref:phosphoketolase family protein n=1 Tax=Metamycoplasma subdolum TaxID=92407 RepID=UPI00298C79D9|nr:phosphoketolase family protein [Metamycoplasma subdolum]WPB50290.1 phosphoketolase family protein [Metamycoplasma subdolum]